MTRRGMTAAAVAGALALTIGTGVALGAVTTTDRLAGNSRYETAVAISEHGFDGAGAVFVARGDVLADALAAGTLTGGPILLVPRCGDPAPAVIAEMDRLDPRIVIALGGEGAVCESTLEAAAGDRMTGRLQGANRFATAVAISEHGFADGAATVYLANAADSPDAVAGGSLQGGPILLVPSSGDVPAVVADEIARLDPAEVVVLGGAAAVSDAMATQAANGRSWRRLAGADRGRTSVAISGEAFRHGSATVLVARQDVFADAVAAGTLDRPILLVPSCGVVSDAILAEVDRLGASTALALGGPGAVCDDVLAQLRGEAPAPDEVLHVIHAVPADRQEQVTTADILHEVAIVDAWYAAQTGGTGLGWDRDGTGAVVVSTVHLRETNAEVQTPDQLAEALAAVGHAGAQLVYAEATGRGPCGETGSSMSVLWMPACNIHPSATTSRFPYGATYLAAHELAHLLGAVPSCAPNYGNGGHVVDDPRDLLYAGTSGRDWDNITLDPGRDDYYGHGRGDCTDIADSPLWAR